MNAGEMLRHRLIDPQSPDRRPRRVAYALPTFFTAANMFLGFVSITKSVEGALQAAQGANHNPYFELSAQVIGVAVALDGLDGRIARMTNTVSDFGREMDSLADVVSFGIAPAVLAFSWGVYFCAGFDASPWGQHMRNAGYFLSFLFLLCGSLRLARFNVQTNPVPRNPGPRDRKYFVGLPIPAAAAMVASVVYAANSEPLLQLPYTLLWLALLGLLSFLMVSTWRYRSFKDINMLQPRSPLNVVLNGVLIYMMVMFSKPVLLGLSILYVGSGIAVRLGGIVKRIVQPDTNPPAPATEPH
jgi:CDP-diacylglycerol---serine O-phosphatidyltransferase